MRRKGQSILEYTLVLAVIIGIVAVAAFNILKPKTEGIYNRTGQAVEGAKGELEGKGIFGFGLISGLASSRDCWGAASKSFISILGSLVGWGLRLFFFSRLPTGILKLAALTKVLMLDFETFI